uniref:C-type lectin domain-containing protein n=1 Tax=Cyprinus carpio TaxID=7962 RepID=A0A8C2B786_CYPCA
YLISACLTLFNKAANGSPFNLVKKCPYGWTNLGVRCYKFFSQMVTWITAEKNCQNLDANLASVHSKIEHDFLMSLLPSSSTRCWFGAHDAQWLWTDGTPFDYTHWAPGQPDNKGEPRTESCGELNYENNGWNDGTCLTPQGYVCAKYL